MKKLGLSCLLALGVSASAQAELSANIGVTNDYVWRGVTQSGDEAAVSGGVDYGNDSGFYAGVWASNVAGGEEVDLYFGLSGESGDVGYDVGYIYYAYPNNGNGDADFGEIYVGASVGPVSGGIAYTVNAGDGNDGAAFDENDLYLHLSVGTDLEDDWSWGATLGYYEFDHDGDAANGDISYLHWLLELGKSAGDFGDFTLGLSGAEEESGDNDPKLLVSWSKGF